MWYLIVVSLYGATPAALKTPEVISYRPQPALTKCLERGEYGQKVMNLKFGKNSYKFLCVKLLPPTPLKKLK